MKEFPAVPQNLIDAIKNCKRAVICGHLNPDGDCANSAMAMGLLLKTLGKQYINVNEGNFDRPEIEEYGKVAAQEIPEDWLNTDTLGIVVDCSTTDRLGFFAEPYSKLDVAVIDHHSSGVPFGNYRYVFPESPSTTLLIYKVVVACGVEPTEEMCRMLFRGFATDSGFFKFLQAGSSPAIRIVADIVDHNISPSAEYNFINSGRPFGSVQFLAAIINRCESYFDGRLMISHEEPQDHAMFGDNASASDELYAQLLTVKGVEVILFFKQNKKNNKEIVIGMRSAYNSNIDVGAFASEFGGGGHKKAAGASIEGSYEEVKDLVIKAISKYFND